MFFAQRKEREVRFKLALRTVLPSVLFTITLFILFFNIDSFVLFLALMLVVSLVITYINLAVLYSGFSENIIDPTTQMLNYEAIKKIIEKDRGFTHIMAVHVGDLELIRDHYGRDQINHLLKKTIEALLVKLEKMGHKNIPTAYYYGGNFILLLNVEKNSDLTEFEHYFEENQLCFVEDIEVEIKSAIAKKDQNNLTTLLEGLLYSVENNQAHIHFKEENQREQALIARIQEAIASERLSLQFQMVKNATKDIAEFSAKLVDKDKKIIHHKQSLEIIKRLGYEKKFSLMVLEKVFDIVTKQQKQVQIAVSISAVALRHKNMLHLILQRMKEYNIGLGVLVLIVHEERYYKHVDRFEQTVKAYREAGIEIALNNVGGNNATLEYLKHFQVDYVRYDKSFSQNSKDPYVRSIFDGIDKAIQERAIKRWVTQIEDQETYERFKTRCIEYFQGWYLQKYEEANQFNTYIKEHYEIR